MAAAVRELSGAAAFGARLGRGLDLLRAVPALTLALFLAPVAAGLLGTVLPAFGWLPTLGGTRFSLEPWQRLLLAPELASALRLTLTSGLTASVGSVAIVVMLCAAAHDTRLFRAVQRLLAPMLAIPHAAVALGLGFLLAPSGWLVRLLSPWATGWTAPPDLPTVQDPLGLALALGLVVKEVPYLLLMTIAAMAQLEVKESLAVARSLGYRPLTAWLKAVLPRIYPQLRLPIYAVIAYSLSVVDMALILAPATPPPLAVLLMRWFADADLAMRFAGAAGAILQLLIVVAAIAAWRTAEAGFARLGRAWVAAGRRGREAQAARIVVAVVVIALVGLAAASFMANAVWSVAERWRYPAALPSEWSLTRWHREAGNLGALAWTTALLGAASALGALALTLGCLENEQRHGLHVSNRGLWLIYAPLLVPQVSFLFGVQVLLVVVGLDGGWLGLAWCHLLFVLPYVFLSVADPFRSLDQRYARSARCLGASPTRVFWRIKLPMLRRPILAALAIGFAVSAAQYLPTLFAAAGRVGTLTTEAVGLATGADRRVIGVYALTQAMLPLLPFAFAILLPARRPIATPARAIP
jgi:putative thiamine transport system permease protein